MLSTNPDKMPVTPNKDSCELGCRLAKQGPRTTSFSPGARCEKYAKETTLNILQVNISGLQNKTAELCKMLQDYKIHLALIQETILPKREISVSGYTQYKCNCTKCQGIMTLVRNDVQATVSNSPSDDIDRQEVTLWTKNNQKYTIYNIYCPPSSINDLPFFNHHQKKTIIAGDFNAHLPTLGYKNYNFRGTEVEALCNSSNLIVKQTIDTMPTLLHKAHGTTSRPDLTIISADIFDETEIKVLDDIGSDHRPILTTVNLDKPSPKETRKTLWNFRKANWEKFREETDTGFNNINYNRPIEEVYSNICCTILTAAKNTIPRGNRKRYKAFWNQELEDAVKARKKARMEAEEETSVQKRKEYNHLTAKVRLLTKKSKRKHWTEKCNKLDLKRNGHKAWNLLHNLEGKSKRINPWPIKDEGNTVTDNKKKAEVFNKFFADVNKSHKRQKLDTALWKAAMSQSFSSPIEDEVVFESPLSMKEMQAALEKLSNNKAAGTDNIRNEMLKQLGEGAKVHLLNFINQTWMKGELPSSWRTAIITPILKKGKPTEQPQSYRPISLTSCVGKLVERIINNRLYCWLEKKNLINRNQAGFRQGCRTEDQLFRFTQEVIDGFQKENSTVAVFIDLQQAYDRVWRKGLLIKMHKLGIYGKMFKWIQAFLKERTISTRLNNTTSSKRTLEEGLPQGSSLSCTLFNIFINDLALHVDLPTALYADDLVIWTSDKHPIVSKRKLNRELLTISTYCNLWKLKLNKTKTVYTIFSKSHKKASQNINVKIGGDSVNKEDHPVYLGVKLDRGMTFKEHTIDLKEKANKKLNLLKRLASTTWGSNKQALRHLYMGYVRSTMDYCLPLQTVANKSAMSALDRVENQALRLICGAMKTTPTSACEIEANICPRDLRRKSALLESVERYKRKENHPNKALVDNWKPTKRIKQKSLLDKAVEEEQTGLLPQNRTIENPCSGPAPWEHYLLPTVRTTLNQTLARKEQVTSTPPYKPFRDHI